MNVLFLAVILLSTLITGAIGVFGRNPAWVAFAGVLMILAGLGLNQTGIERLVGKTTIAIDANTSQVTYQYSQETSVSSDYFSIGLVLFGVYLVSAAAYYYRHGFEEETGVYEVEP